LGIAPLTLDIIVELDLWNRYVIVKEPFYNLIVSVLILTMEFILHAVELMLLQEIMMR